jgi:starch phosphorylase
MDNILIFGMRAHEVDDLRRQGYSPAAVLAQNAVLRDVIDALHKGINGETFSDIANMLSTSDYYMALADFNSYSKTRQNAFETYKDLEKWQSMSMVNTAKSHFFSADRSISEYAQNIWHI